MLNILIAYAVYVKHFVDCVLEGKEPVIKPADGLNNVKIIEAVEKSVKSGKKVDIVY